MSTLTIEDAQARLAEIIGTLNPGQEIVITQNDQPVAQLSSVPSRSPRPVPGRGKGMLTIHAEDDEPERLG